MTNRQLDTAILVFIGMFVVALALLAVDQRRSLNAMKAQLAALPPVPSGAPPPRQPAERKDHETMCFQTLSEYGRERARGRCELQHGYPEIDHEKVVCYRAKNHLQGRHFTYTADQAMMNDLGLGHDEFNGAGGSP